MADWWVMLFAWFLLLLMFRLMILCLICLFGGLSLLVVVLVLGLFACVCLVDLLIWCLRLLGWLKARCLGMFCFKLFLVFVYMDLFSFADLFV